MEVTNIEFVGIHITEPFTWLTNWLVAAFSFYFGHMLYHDRAEDEQKKYWSLFFLFIGLASIMGGTAHGFIQYVGHNFHLAAWVFTGLAVFSAQLASLHLIENRKLSFALTFFVYTEVVLMTISVIFFDSFESVRVNSAFGLIGVVLPIQLIYYLKYKTRRNGLIVIGILANIMPALIHAIELSYNQWFNFNDLSHVVMIGCLYIIYYGVKQPHPASPVPTT